MGKRSGFSSVPLLIGVILVAAVASVISVVVLRDVFGQRGTGESLEFEYDMDKLRRIDPALILYEEIESRIETGFDRARAVAVSLKDHIYVVGDQAIHSFDPTGQKLTNQIELEQQPTSITAAEDGTLYVAVGDHVEVFDPSGRLKKRWESVGTEAVLTSIGVSGDHVFVADFSSRSVLHYDTSGNQKESFGDFVLPSSYFDLAVSPDGLLQVANTGKHRIEAYDLDGNLVSWWGEFSNTDIKGFCGCCNPVNFAVLPDGEGFVTCEKGLTRVKVYDGKGTFMGVVAGPKQFARHDRLCAALGYDCNRGGLDVAVDSKGRVFVLDPLLAEVRMFRRINQPDSGN